METLMKFIHDNWFSLLNLILLSFGYWLSNKNAKKALIASREANSISKKALTKANIQFTEVNRPILLAKIEKLPNGRYYDPVKIGESRMNIIVVIALSNIGNAIAAKTSIEEAAVLLASGGKTIAGKRNYYDCLGRPHDSPDDAQKSNFTLLDVPPGSVFLRQLDFDIDFGKKDCNVDQVLELFRTGDLIVNLTLHLRCTYRQMEEKIFSTHITYAITNNGILTLEYRII